MNTMTAFEQTSGLATAARDEHIVNYIAGALAYTTSCAEISIVIVAFLTWLVYDIALTADSEVIIAYYGLDDTESDCCRYRSIYYESWSYHQTDPLGTIVLTPD
jgi:hypothetical protein